MFTSTGPATAAFFIGALFCLAGSSVLVSRIERLAGRLGITEAMLGLGVALGADSPEIVSAITAATHGQRNIGVGIVLGSNAFNLAALLGLGSLVAGRIALHRRVVLLEGAVATWVAMVSVVAISVGLDAHVGLCLVLVAVIPYVVVSACSPDTLRGFRIPDRSVAWIHEAILEEESELGSALHNQRHSGWDIPVALASLVVVVGASSAMEQAASTLGSRYDVSNLIVGAIVLAAATSLPNAVGAIFLARRGRGAAVLSETVNSNTLNVLVGLFIPASFLGLARPSAQGLLVAAWYLGLTVVGLLLAYVGRGLGRRAGLAIVLTYLAFVAIVLTR